MDSQKFEEISPAAPVAVVGRRYVLREKLGAGSMGVVYQALDRLTGTPVALKRVTAPATRWQFNARKTDGGNTRLALAHEFQTLASMRHPNIISVLDYGFDDARQPYFAMELLDHPKTILDAGRGQPLNVKIDLIIQMLRALTYIHRRGVVHRDLKPTNVLVVGEHQVKLLDFGLAISPENEDIEDENTSGTLAYMSPEVLLGSPASVASDLYAIGVIAYELIGGRHPFEINDVSRLINQILNEAPETIGLPVNADVALVLERLLAKKPGARFPDAMTAILALSEAVGEPPPSETSAIREGFLQSALFVGREYELNVLARALDMAQEGKGSAWLVGGESGVGKSRLLLELRTLALVNGALALRGQAVSEGGGAYQLWREPMRALAALTPLDDNEAGVLKPYIPDIAVLVGRPVSHVTQLDAKAAQTRLFVTILNILKRQPQPLVITVEDLHWANPEDLSLLQRLAAAAPELHLLLLGSYRDDERPQLPASLPEMESFHLERLPRAAIADLAESMLGAAGRNPALVEFLQRETEGNVLFLVEVVRTLAEDAGQLERVGDVPLPVNIFSGGLREVVQRRLGKLPPDARQLLDVAAVIGRQIDPALMQYLAPGTRLDEWLNSCASAAVLSVQDGVWRFDHDKLREGALFEMDAATRRTHHARVAGAMEQVYAAAPEHYAALAYHWGMAKNTAAEARFAGMAGAQALSVSAFADAARLFERALQLSQGSAKETAMLMQQLAEASIGLSDFERAKRQYQESLALCRVARERSGIACSLNGLGTVAEAHGDYAEAARYFDESLTIYREMRDQAGEADVLSNLSNLAYKQGDYGKARELAHEALYVNRLIDNKVGIANTLRGLGVLLASIGNYKAATQQFEESLALYREVGQRLGIAAVVNNLGVLAGYAGDFRRAKALYYESLAMKAEIGDKRGRATSLNNLSIVTLRLGEHEESRLLLQECLDYYEAVGDKQGIADSMINMGRVVLATGDYEEARRLFERGRALSAELGEQWGVALALLNMGHLARQLDEDADAARLFYESLHIANGIRKASTILAILVEFALLWAKHGRAQDAFALASFTRQHPAIDSEFKDYADTLYADLSPALPPYLKSTALIRYGSLDAAVADVLKQESQG